VFNQITRGIRVLMKVCDIDRDIAIRTIKSAGKSIPIAVVMLKAGVDKMAADMAVDFRDTGVATASIWMGILLTERFRSAFEGHPEALAETAKHAETPQFTGHLINALYHDPDLAALSGHTVIGAELALRYGITDEGGRQPPSHREMLGAPREPSAVIVR